MHTYAFSIRKFVHLCPKVCTGLSRSLIAAYMPLYAFASFYVRYMQEPFPTRNGSGIQINSRGCFERR